MTSVYVLPRADVKVFGKSGCLLDQTRMTMTRSLTGSGFIHHFTSKARLSIQAVICANTWFSNMISY